MRIRKTLPSLLLVILLGSSFHYRLLVWLFILGAICSATTHTDILLRARQQNIPTQVIHNASILNAVGACGLQLYNFGQAVSLVFFTESWKPDSFYDRVKENAALGCHTLLLLDIKVKEQSEENMARYVSASYQSFPTVSPMMANSPFQRS
jgi:diphthine synthase